MQSLNYPSHRHQEHLQADTLKPNLMSRRDMLRGSLAAIVSGYVANTAQAQKKMKEAEVLSAERKDTIESTIEKDNGEHGWHAIDFGDNQWEGRNILEAKKKQEQIISISADIMTRKSEGNILIPIPRTSVGQRQLKSKAFVFINGKLYEEGLASTEIIKTKPDEHNPHTNAFFNVRLEGVGKNDHVAIRTIHHIEQEVFANDNGSMDDFKNQLLTENIIPAEEWKKMGGPLLSASKIIQDSNVQGTHWKIALDNNRRGDCGPKAALLQKLLRDRGFEAVLVEGYKTEQERIEENGGIHIFCLCKTSAGTVLLDPERISRYYVGPQNEKYIMTTMGSDLHIKVPSQNSQPPPTGGFNLGHFWGKNADESTNLHLSTKNAGQDKDLLRKLEL